MRFAIGLVTLLCWAGPALADVRLPKIFTSQMVLQQEMPIVVWGKADVQEKVTVRFKAETAKTQADDQGRWRVRLPAMKADGKAHELIVRGNNVIALKNILLGEVWLASGQSNMNRPVAAADIRAAKHPNLRLFTTNGKIPRRERLNDTVGWVPCTPKSIAVCGDVIGANNRRRPFSEVAYHFGRRLHEQLRVPVGIIHTSMGGSTAKDWTPNAKIAEQYPFDKDHGDVRHKSGIVYRPGLFTSGVDDGWNHCVMLCV